jgi:L-ascorbate metabolism protein UlaG (beta-lactamase superfamily)
MIRPVLMNEEFLEDVRAASAEPDRHHLWWLGQSGFLLQWQGSHVLLDPYLSDSLTRKYAATNTPHVRMTERLVAPEKLDFIDIVTSSHNHTDHLDGETLGALLGANPGLAILVSEANREFAAQRLQLPADRLTGIPTDRAVKVNELTFTALPSAHEELETDASGSWRYIGLVIQSGPLTLYHSGDTVRYPGLHEQLRKYRIDLALLPINGRDPKRGVAGNLSGIEAARLAHDSQIKLVIPCHYEMFAFNTASPDEFVQEAQRLDQPYRVLKCGERFSLPV